MVSLFVVLFFFKSRIEVLTLFFFGFVFCLWFIVSWCGFLIFDLFIRFFSRELLLDVGFSIAS